MISNGFSILAASHNYEIRYKPACTTEILWVQCSWEREYGGDLAALA
jgi:hypothetical protein